jgi:hypothetical protein
MSDMQQVLDKLEEIDGKLDDLLRWKAGLDERCSGQREKTEELRREMFAADGLKQKVQRLWNCKGALRDKVAMWQDFGMYVLKALIVAGLLAAIAIVMKVYKSSGQ